MASLQSNPLGEDMQEVMGVGGDYDREEYEVGQKRNINIDNACRWELEDLEEAIHIQEADQIPRLPSALTLVGFHPLQLKKKHSNHSDFENCPTNLERGYKIHLASKNG